MSQNTSHAVMAQRHEAHDSLDSFPTPRWATRAFCDWLGPRHTATVWEPACGAGHMARALSECFGHVVATDIAADQIGYGQRLDFLLEPPPPALFPAGKVDAIVTNPPFRLAATFIQHALLHAPIVAMLVRTVLLHGCKRHRDLFATNPPTDVLVFCERVPMIKGRCLRNASTATDYVWLVWMPYREATRSTVVSWIPPGTRKRLERWGDYDDDVGPERAGSPPAPASPAPHTMPLPAGAPGQDWNDGLTRGAA